MTPPSRTPPEQPVPTVSVPPRQQEPPSVAPAAPSPAPGAQVKVEATAKGTWWGKPPLKTHLLDVTMQNLAPEARWIALAETFPYEGSDEPRLGEGKVGELQVYELSTRPRVVLVLTVATGGMWAVRLPPMAEVTLRSLPVDSWWRRLPATAELEVASARDILVGGEPLAACFDAKATSDSGADVKAPRDAADERIVRTRCPRGDASVPIELVDARRSRISVAVGSAPHL